MKKLLSQKILHTFLCTFLCLCMVMSLMPTKVFADESTDNTCGENVIWTFDLNSGKLTISGTGDMDNFSHPDFSTEEKAPWDSYRESIKSVVIEEGVTTIGDFAFYGCTNLTNVSIADSVKYIWNSAFYGCTSLESVTIPNSVSHIGAETFRSCTSLKSVSIPSSVTVIGAGAFFKCTGITSITIPASVESIHPHAFENCSGLATVTYVGTTPLTGSCVFEGCDFESVNVPIGYADDLFCGKSVNKSSDVSVGDVITMTYERNETIVCENHNITDGICTLCGAYISHVHSIDGSTGKCTTCGAKPGRAKVTNGNGVLIAEYDSIAAAMVAAAEGSGQRVYALSDSDENFTIKAGINFYGDVYELSGDIYNYGMIMAGNFAGTVTNARDSNGNRGRISNGSFSGTVKNGKTCGIAGGEFYGKVINDGIISNGVFKNTVTNMGGLEKGSYPNDYESSDLTGIIWGGEFSGKLINKSDGIIDNTTDYFYVSLSAGFPSDIVNEGGTILCENHSGFSDAACSGKAICHVCGEYGEMTEHQRGRIVLNKAGDTIFDRCENCDKAFGSVTIRAEDSVYDGTLYSGASVSYSDGWIGDRSMEISYMTAEGIALDAAPVDVGEYIAIITLTTSENSTITASAKFKINKEATSLPTEPDDTENAEDSTTDDVISEDKEAGSSEANKPDNTMSPDTEKAGLSEANKPNNSISPNTGDDSNNWLLTLLFISGSVMLTQIVYDRRRNHGKPRESA